MPFVGGELGQFPGVEDQELGSGRKGGSLSLEWVAGFVWNTQYSMEIDTIHHYRAHAPYGIIGHMEAELLFRDKYVYRDGAIREMVIWRLPAPDAERPHGLKYRLYYGQSGHCLVRYDNERGKGDHRHYGETGGQEREEDYAWTSVQQLIADFKADIERLRGEQHD